MITYYFLPSQCKSLFFPPTNELWKMVLLLCVLSRNLDWPYLPDYATFIQVARQRTYHSDDRLSEYAGLGRVTLYCNGFPSSTSITALKVPYSSQMSYRGQSSQRCGKYFSLYFVGRFP